ncbi:twin-arginine translocase TatA/TatE family subunit [Corynebacterium tuberculostearicum]|uniref:Sec-independent protein translocase protein TatB n=2 Tax=Corynebacterium tuberculostearicum TaxID=38304 RepID=A0A7Y9ZWK5_9CORY|nr:twin-arginine translocase TatA/TatE family subunit [Corynebacterium tuberculostearicum]EET77664.1 twin arginine-targeting protein translocase TatB [Corynebacterium tuberculostearicum SK141]MBK3426965.1 twin-arginine translocase TatA/TatE family subunit [Corynebacterium tuberculostearicum]MCG7458825.1 twin-arginine translocase TatA/TatE family subunit [Corynebacterium tuberculostearicum]NYI55178.1 sec-independent protein translocase protein TatB [Corynebacterium tuberculostearicum]QQU81492.1
MFSSIGWPEIFVIVVLGIIVIGPERMPEVIKDVRAAIYAARKAINNAKAELNGEMGSITSEFDDIRGPLTQAAQWTRLGPKGAITKALFDGDDSAWDDFNPKKMAENVKTATAPQEPEEQPQPQPQQQRRPSFDYSQVYAEQPQPEPQQRPQAPQPTEQPAPEKKPPRGGEESTGGGLWGDVT